MPRLPALATILIAWPVLGLAGEQCPAQLPVIPPPPAPSVVPTAMPTPGAGPAPLSAAAIAASPILSRLASHGAVLSALEPEHGLRTVFARSGDHFQVFYLTPDDRAAIGGVMWNATGHDITRDQVTPIAGTIPTIRWHPNQPDVEPDKGAAVEAGVGPFARLNGTSYGVVGQSSAPRLYMVIDPLCPFSVRAMTALQPYVASGALQLAIVPISINDHENGGASTPAALDLITAGRAGMADAWRAITVLGHARPDHPPASDAEAQLQLNMAAAHAIALQGTPTLVWRDAEGHGHSRAGLPADTQEWDDLVAGLHA